MAARGGPPDHITVDSSFLRGGVGADMQEGCGSSYITVTNNAFSSDNGYGGNDYIYGYNPSDTAMSWTRELRGRDECRLRPAREQLLTPC